MSIYEFQVKSIHDSPVCISIYREKVLLVVNTASRCSYSRQFADLQKLYETHLAKGFEVLGFPCHQFNEKEPGSNLEIQEYCKGNFGLTFPLFAKVEVRGPSAHPLFQYLTQQAPFHGYDSKTVNGIGMRDFLQKKYPNIYAGDGIKWNFSKFLIDRNGHVLKRYETTTEPSAIEMDIKSIL